MHDALRYMSILHDALYENLKPTYVYSEAVIDFPCWEKILAPTMEFKSISCACQAACITTLPRGRPELVGSKPCIYVGDRNWGLMTYSVGQGNLR